MNINKLILRAVLLAKDRAPKDTGNLAFNSIRGFRTPTGFRIVQLGNAAPYGSILNYRQKPRSQKEIANVGWWSGENGVYGALNRYMKTNLDSQLDSESYKRVALQSKNNERREKLFNRSIPKG